MGAPESNAGDDFHFWWAAQHALELIRPGTPLRLVTVEGLARVDDPDGSYETVDVGEYSGGDTVATATSVVLSQLKYSTRNPDSPWTAGRICEPHNRRPQNGTASGQKRSVIGDLAMAYQKVLHGHSPDCAEKVRLALVSNRPGEPHLLTGVAQAAAVIRDLRNTDRQPGLDDLHLRLAHEHWELIKKLTSAVTAAVGDKLDEAQICQFVAALDLTQLGTLGRGPLARSIQAAAAQSSPDHPWSAQQMFTLVREQAMPDGRGGIRASDVLAAFGVSSAADLYPAPPRFSDGPDPLPAPGARLIADAVLAHPGQIVVAHGPARSGRTTALRQVGDHLPKGSAVVVFDCYGNGDYRDAGRERHTPDRFVTQVVNELAHLCHTPMLIRPPKRVPDLWSRFGRLLESAAAAMEPGCVLVLAVDAADRAVEAAQSLHDERSFVPDLLRLPVPDRVTVVLTAPTSSLPSLGLDGRSAVLLEIEPSESATPTAHLPPYQPGAAGPGIAGFRARAGRDPDAQVEAPTVAESDHLDVADMLERYQPSRAIGSAAGTRQRRRGRWPAVDIAAVTAFTALLLGWMFGGLALNARESVRDHSTLSHCGTPSSPLFAFQNFGWEDSHVGSTATLDTLSDQVFEHLSARDLPVRERREAELTRLPALPAGTSAEARGAAYAKETEDQDRCPSVILSGYVAAGDSQELHVELYLADRYITGEGYELTGRHELGSFAVFSSLGEADGAEKAVVDAAGLSAELIGIVDDYVRGDYASVLRRIPPLLTTETRLDQVARFLELLQGNAFLRSGETDEAEASYRTAAGPAGDYPRAQLGLAETHYAQRNGKGCAPGTVTDPDALARVREEYEVLRSVGQGGEYDLLQKIDLGEARLLICLGEARVPGPWSAGWEATARTHLDALFAEYGRRPASSPQAGRLRPLVATAHALSGTIDLVPDHPDAARLEHAGRELTQAVDLTPSRSAKVQYLKTLALGVRARQGDRAREAACLRDAAAASLDTQQRQELEKLLATLPTIAPTVTC